ncbi:hypothetical protein COU36_00670 [Candidatus Micrarchaeota archaeon CG10_big_fil_rev_8_21_14_0_10_59_7]|nr:MAG: hypothetical protein COU36_00670 [Candidatus Micrarchaeota archaeon CG10_big_fil_rev_8_21_14_0_10_59_7]
MGVFSDESVLSPEFLPEDLPGRDAELRAIADALRPALAGRRPIPLFIWGKTGTGKTSSVKNVIREFKEHADAVMLYVNCWQNYTRQSVLSELSTALGEPLPRRGLASDEIFSRIIEAVRKKRAVPILVLDEADRLFVGGEERILYDLTRATENYGVSFGIVCISNEFAAFSRLDDRIRSAFLGGKIEFKPYSPIELREILQARARKAFQHGACPQEVIGMCAAHASKKGGDARVAIEALWLAGRNAEKRDASAITSADVKNALKSEHVEQAQGVSEGEAKVLAALKAAGGTLMSGELYKHFSGASARSVRNYVQSLEAKRLITLKEVALKQGRTRVIELTR